MRPRLGKFENAPSIPGVLLLVTLVESAIDYTDSAGVGKSRRHRGANPRGVSEKVTSVNVRDERVSRRHRT